MGLPATRDRGDLWETRTDAPLGRVSALASHGGTAPAEGVQVRCGGPGQEGVRVCGDLCDAVPTRSLVQLHPPPHFHRVESLLR